MMRVDLVESLDMRQILHELDGYYLRMTKHRLACHKKASLLVSYRVNPKWNMIRM
jgi:hypothetical protein